MAEQLDLFPDYKPAETQTIIQSEKYIENPEWCFQFFDNEPVPFAYNKVGGMKSPLVLEVKPIQSEGLIFQYKGMSFKIFAREMSEETKREIQNESKD
jgi:hypothetical protein